MTKWEYRVVDVNNLTKDGEYEALLNRLGAEGWELVSAAHDGHGGFIRFAFKRPLGA